MVESLLAFQYLPVLLDMVASLSWRATILSVGPMVLTSIAEKTELSTTSWMASSFTWMMTRLNKSCYPVTPCIIPGSAALPG